MARKHAERDIVASTPYRPPTAGATRSGGRRVVVRVASAGVLVGATILAAVALGGAGSSGPVEVRFQPPQAPAAVAPPQARLVVDRAARRVTLVRDGSAAWRARGPIHCVSGRRWRSVENRAALVSHACVRLRSGAVVALAGRVPAGVAVKVR
jgi:hypothetical protein